MGYLTGVYTLHGQVVDAAQGAGMDLSQELLSSGYVDMCMAALHCSQSCGVNRGAEIELIVYGLMVGFATWDGQALPMIDDKLRAEGALALRWAIDTELSHIKDFGYVLSSNAAWLCARLWGREEDSGGFTFSQEEMDGMIATSSEYVPTH